MVRSFVAIPLPVSCQEILAQIVSELRPSLASKISWVRPGNGHLTLRFLGNLTEARLAAVTSELAGIRSESFVIRLGGAGFFPSAIRPRVLWTGLVQGEAACGGLAQQVSGALTRAGLAPDPRPFQPHLTLGRIRRDRQDGWAAVERRVEATAWPDLVVDEFVLFRSDIGPQGPSYTRLETFSL